MIALLAVIAVVGVTIMGSVVVRAKQALIDDAQSGTRGYF